MTCEVKVRQSEVTFEDALGTQPAARSSSPHHRRHQTKTKRVATLTAI